MSRQQWELTCSSTPVLLAIVAAAMTPALVTAHVGIFTNTQMLTSNAPVGEKVIYITDLNVGVVVYMYFCTAKMSWLFEIWLFQLPICFLNTWH